MRVIIFITLCLYLSSTLAHKFNRHLRRAAHHSHNFVIDEDESSLSDYETAYFNQTLDHYNYYQGINSETWQQRYLYNDTFWSGADELGPILFYCGNESPVETYWNTDRFIIDVLAPELGAYIVFVEHRFFGESLPFGNNSFNPENIVYLTTDQAMADYVVFLNDFKASTLNCRDCPVIAFGGSYGGMLAAWMRMKFPNVIDGSIAASAPIRMFDFVEDPEVAYEIVTWDFGNATSAPQCSDVIRNAFERLTNYSNINGNQYQLINQVFNVCHPLSSNEYISYIIGWSTGALFTLAELNYPYPFDYISPLPANPVNFACQAFIGLTVESSDEEVFAALAQASKLAYDYLNQTTCNNILDPPSGNVGVLGWDVLACSEMALIMPNNGVQDFFPPSPWNSTAYTDECEQSWGIEPRYDWAMEYFGGFSLDDYQYYSNIFFSNGNLDPWMGGGVTTNISESLISFVIDQGAHHLDLFGPNPADPPSVITAREMETNYIKQWIQEKRQRVYARRLRDL